MRDSKLFLILGLSLFTATYIWAGDPWKEKPYKSWSEKECLKLLEKSPWAKLYVLSRPHIEAIVTGPSTDRRRERNPKIEYQVQLRSALPVRQAQVRAAQLRLNYEAMTPEEKARFDRWTEGMLDSSSFLDLVGVHVTYGSNVSLWNLELARYWRRQTLETLKNSTYLIGTGGRRAPLLKYTMSEGGRQEFVFIFPRHEKDKPLLGPSDKRLLLEFVQPQIGEQARTRVLVEFPVKKMLIDGQVIY